MRFFENANISLHPSPHKVRQNITAPNAVTTDGKTGLQAEDGKVLLDENGNAIILE